MGYTNGSSGDSRSSQDTRQKGYKGPPGIGFSLTADEHYHIKNKRLTNVSALLSITATQLLRNLSLIY